MKVNKNFENIIMVGGGSKSSFWIKLLSTLLKRKLSVCDQSEYGAALGVSRLAMYVDKDVPNKNIIKDIVVSRKFEPQEEKTELLLKRYNIWKDIYHSNKKIASSLLT